MTGNNVLSELASLNPTSGDGKKLVPIIRSLFQKFEESLTAMFTEQVDKLRSDFHNLVESQNAEISSLRETVQQQRLLVSNLNSKVSKLELGLDEADAYERRDTLIISGQNIPVGYNGENCVEVVRQLSLDKLGLTFDACDVSTAHRLGKRNNPESPDKRGIIVKFCRRDISKRLFSAARTKRPVNLYINESLTPTRRKILYALRQIKKAHPNIVSGCTSQDGKVFVYTKPSANSPPEAQNLKTPINSNDQLISFCRDFIKRPLDEFLGAQNH